MIPAVRVLPGIRGGVKGMRAFRDTATDNSSGTYTWTAPAGVTHVMAEMWGGGGGSDGSSGVFVGGGGGGYSRSVLAVVPGAIYTITVGRGGFSDISFEDEPTDGSATRTMYGTTTLIFAGGGGVARGHFPGRGGEGDPSAAITGTGNQSSAGGGGAAFGSHLSPNGPSTGHGGGLLSAGHPGYVLLSW